MTLLDLRSAMIAATLLVFLPMPADAGVLLGGGQVLNDGQTGFSNFVGTHLHDSSDPNAEKITQARLPAGTLSKLKVNIVTANTGGSATIMIRINNADTPLTCSVTSTTMFAKCSSNASFTVPNNAALAVRLTNTSGNASGALFNYSLQFD